MLKEKMIERLTEEIELKKNENETLKDCFIQLLEEKSEALNSDIYVLLTPNVHTAHASLRDIAYLISKLVQSLFVQIDSDEEKDTATRLLRGAIDFGSFMAKVKGTDIAEVMEGLFDLSETLDAVNNKED